MSLILEALKKLEREKNVGDRGLVVLSHLPWAGGRTGERGPLRWVLAALLAILLLAGGALPFWISRGALPPRSSAGPALTTPPLAPAAPPAAGALQSVPPVAWDTRAVAVRPEAPAYRLPVRDPAPTPASEGPAPAETLPPRHGEVRLNAISVRDGRPVAILNDRLVREGDSFDGIRVVRIGEAEVEVEVDGVRRTLRF